MDQETDEQMLEQARQERKQLIKDTITSLFRPTPLLKGSDEQYRSRELYEHMCRELPIDLGYIELVECLNELRFFRTAINGEGFWLVKYA